MRANWSKRPWICVSCLTRAAGQATRSYYRPSNAPKPNIDLKHIAKNPGLYEQECNDRNYKKQAKDGWRVLELREELAKLHKEQTLSRVGNKSAQWNIEQLRKRGIEGQEMDTWLQQAKVYKQELSDVGSKTLEIENEMLDLGLGLPNLSSFETPTGSEADVVREDRRPQSDASEVGISHVEIGNRLGILDFAGSANTTGWGWYFLKDEGALLEQALIQYALSVLHERGWSLISPPSIVYSHIAAACGFQPRDQNGEQQIYDLKQNERDISKPTLSLAATAEIPLAGMKAQSQINEEALPIKTAAVSRCYRAEAGARGVDTKGLYRVHEFTKVEMFAWTRPDDHIDQDSSPNMDRSSAADVFTEMVDIQTKIIKDLALDFRILEMPSMDLGASAARKRDIEVFFPSRRSRNEGWGEVTSASICTDYQTRRLETRLKRRDGSLDFPYTVNGTAMAVPRVLAAILETYWDDARGQITVPKVLQPWMYGIDTVQSK